MIEAEGTISWPRCLKKSRKDCLIFAVVHCIEASILTYSRFLFPLPSEGCCARFSYNRGCGSEPSRHRRERRHLSLEAETSRFGGESERAGDGYGVACGGGIQEFPLHA